MEKLCCFCDIGSSFLRVFPKMQQNFCDSDIRIGTKEFAQNAGNCISKVLDFKITRGRIPPDPPTNARSLYVCISQLRRWIRPGRICLPMRNSRVKNYLTPEEFQGPRWGPVRGKLRQPTGPFFRRQCSFEILTNDGKEG